MTRRLYVHRSNRAEALAAALADHLRQPLADPLRPERLVVQGRGMATWLSQELATRLTIFTNAEFLYPRNVVQHTYAEVLGRTELPLLGPQGQSVLLFAVLEALGQLAELESRSREAPSAGRAAPASAGATQRGAELTPLSEAERRELAPLLRYLADDVGSHRTHQLAERVARCFDQYLLFRPEMMRAFSDPESTQERPTTPEARWQAALWRRLPESIRQGHVAWLEPSFTQRVRELAESGEAHQLPERVSVFGLSSLPPLYLRTLTQLSQLIEVHLFTLAPSPHWFAERAPRRADPAAPPDPLEHPLLTTLGPLGADLQALIEEHASGYQEPLELFEDPTTGEDPPKLLHRLQRGLLELDQTPEQGVWRGAARALDDTIRIHSCHSPMREVEVLHDTLLDLLQHDPTLEPQDIVVMASDIERYAPFFEAVFEEARGDAQGKRSPRFIPYRIADRAASHDAPVLDGLARLFVLAPGRRTASEFMDLLSLAPVAKRFGMETAELQQIALWIKNTGIRWGRDGEDRARHEQPGEHQNTWRFGLERLLLGYCLPGEGASTFAGCLPYDEVEGHAAELAGKFADFAETLCEVLTELAEARPLPEWHTTLNRALTRLFDATGDHRRLRGGAPARAAGA